MAKNEIHSSVNAGDVFLKSRDCVSVPQKNMFFDSHSLVIAGNRLLIVNSGLVFSPNIQSENLNPAHNYDVIVLDGFALTARMHVFDLHLIFAVDSLDRGDMGVEGAMERLELNRQGRWRRMRKR
jgi:hypothetical protein